MLFKNKWVRYLVLPLLVITVVHVVLVVTDHTYLYKAVRYNFVDIDDYKIFENRTIRKSNRPQPWELSDNYNEDTLTDTLRNTLEQYQSVAYLVIKQDEIVYEEYWDEYGKDALSNSFSMAKSYVGAMIGVALKEGELKSLDEPVANYLPSFAEGEKKHITIRHLLKMSSGLNWDESYSGPFSVTTKAYYGTDLKKIINNLEAEKAPGLEFDYLSGDTQVLAFVLEAATGKSLSQYAEEKLWQPMGGTNDALWSLDKKGGNEKAYCCINSNARDFARLGKLYLNHGNWEGKQLIDSQYVRQAVTPARYENDSIDHYGYQWWLIPGVEGHDMFYARGLNGQYIVVIPDLEMIMVRLGHKRSKEKYRDYHRMALITMIRETMTIFAD